MMIKLNHCDDELLWSTPYAELDWPVIGVLKGARGTLLFDACASHNHALDLTELLRAGGLRAPRYAVISHSHTDHWFGLRDFEAVAICSAACLATTRAMVTYDWSHDGYAHLVAQGSGTVTLAEILDAEYGAGRAGIPLRAPDVGVSGSLTIDLGGVTAQVHEIRGGHSGDAVVMFVPEKKVLFLGDVLYLREDREEDIAALLATLAAFGAEWFIDGHANTIMTRDEMERYLREYLSEL
jgi:glyoxylase-like metal-dependent hydrolase (beta-lactamase superfamily II)